jgi:hypothetical protein
VPKKKVKPETVFYSSNKTINTNGSSNLDFTVGGSNNHQLEPLSTMVCDGVILYSIIPNCELSKHQIIMKKIKKSQEVKEGQMDQEDEKGNS